MRIAPGKVAVRPFENEDRESGVLLADSRRALRGEVVTLGAPQPGLYTIPRMILYHLFGIHPCPFKKGSVVAIPKLVSDVNGVLIFWQSEINVYDL